MALRDHTKRIFADTLEEMTRTMPLEKIRVRDLCERCGGKRQSFYYHFRDKYDLIAWIFLQDYAASLEQSDAEYSEAHIAANLKRIRKKQSFYKKVFSDYSQNAISQYLFEYFVALGINAVKQHFCLEAIDAETLYVIKSHSYATIGHTIEWVEGKTDYTPEEFAHLEYKFMPAVLKESLGLET